MDLPAGTRRALNGATPRIFHTVLQQTEGNEFLTLQEAQGNRYVQDLLNEGLQGARIILLEVRSEMDGGDNDIIEIRAGGGSLFAPFHHYHLQDSTGNRQDSVWVMNRPWDSVFAEWATPDGTPNSSASLRGRVRATNARLVFRAWFRPAPTTAAMSAGYTLNPVTPMDDDNHV